MINAKDAREAIRKKESEKDKLKLALIEQLVNDAIDDGRLYCYVGGDMSSTVKELLKSLGYKVEQIDEKLYTLTW